MSITSVVVVGLVEESQAPKTGVEGIIEEAAKQKLDGDATRLSNPLVLGVIVPIVAAVAVLTTLLATTKMVQLAYLGYTCALPLCYGVVTMCAGELAVCAETLSEKMNDDHDHGVAGSTANTTVTTTTPISSARSSPTLQSIDKVSTSASTKKHSKSIFSQRGGIGGAGGGAKRTRDHKPPYGSIFALTHLAVALLNVIYQLMIRTAFGLHVNVRVRYWCNFVSEPK